MAIKKWSSACSNSESVINGLMRKFAFPRPIAMYLTARKIAENDVDVFLNGRLSGLSDPYRFPGIKNAVKCLWNAILEQAPILIHGDYDTDGITATALLADVLRQNGAETYTFIPHRFDDGYGFTPASLHKAVESIGKPCKVLVTVDCGITSCDAVREAGKMGISTIITDHHDPGKEIPEAIALINPKLHPEIEDLRILAGAGVAFKLSHAFIKYGRENNLGGFSTKLSEVLDFVALGTIADIVPLLGENRIMVKSGIRVLRKQVRPGIRALIEMSKLKSELSPSDITFKLAPRLNAAGRMCNADIALRLLECDNIVEAYRFSSELEELNNVRQTKEQEIYLEARRQIKEKLDLDNNYSILVAGHNWHQGVIGIVASRLARDFNRPAIVLTIQDGKAYGSGRSVGNLNLVAALSNISGILERFGGHPMAVGVALDSDNIDIFYASLEKYFKDEIPDLGLMEESISYDGEVDLEELSDDFFAYLKQLGPFGHSNPKPVFRINDLELVKSYPVGERHTRGLLRNHKHSEIGFIAFNFLPEQFSGALLDVLATPQLNTYGPVSKPQLHIVALQTVY
ncbi:MAG: single-stranded-DNA-specific exonuclease RecJ, partial [Victivallales bacterium]|nr:single-stranded-DNA-specific exonuclease RecJ [Victivallales bacterium]